MDIADATVLELSQGFAAGTLDPVDVADGYLDRIANNADQNVYITVMAERARAEAQASRKRYREDRPAGPLDGVPIAWKDLFDVAGSPTTSGAEIYRNRSNAEADAPTVAACASAGMVTLGKLNLTEFAFSGLGLNPHYGTPHNPFSADTPRAPGGSSSGSAVAVASGLAPIAMGTDTGGSVRVPASFNGLVGYKTSEGHIDKSGVQALSLTLDTVGPLGRRVVDCVLIERAMRGSLIVAPRPAGLSDCTLLVPENVVFDNADDAVVANFERALSKLSSQGVKVVRRKLAPLDAMLDLSTKHGTLITGEAYYVHHDLVETAERERIDRRVVARIEMGKPMTAYDFITIREGRARLMAELAAEMEGPTFMVSPTTAITAPEIAPLDADDELFNTTNMKALRNTMIGNFFNLCGFSMPSGVDAKGLPTGILFSATGGEDERLICYAQSLESTLEETVDV